jgi:hypothetical protein
MMKRIAEASPRLEGRIAGVLSLLLLLTAAFTEFFVCGRLSFAADLAAGFIEVSCMIAVTLLFYDIFKPVNRRPSLLAASFNFVGLIFEVLQFFASWREHRPGISRILLDPDRVPHLQVDLPTSNSGRTAGDRGFVLAYLSATAARKPSIPLQSGLRPPRGRIGDVVAPRDGGERPAMEGAGWRSGERQ